MFSAVLIKTAVVGNHQNIQEAIFESQRPSTSLFLSNFSFVILLAAFADIIVSKTAIIATTVEVTKSVFHIFKTSFKPSIFILLKGNSHILKVSSVNILERSSIFGNAQLLTKSHIIIHTTVRKITEGNFGKNFFQAIKKLNQAKNTVNATLFMLSILLIISSIFK
jgi:hypothetical protein